MGLQALFSLRSLLIVLVAATATNADLSPPHDDPFYAVPSNIGIYKPGDVVDTRPITDKNGLAATQISYRTNGINNAPDLTVATVWAPNILLPAFHPPRLVVFTDAEDADNIDCSPSWAMVNGSNSSYTGLKGDAALFVTPAAVFKGYYVVMPDYQGSNSSWLVGAIEGQAVLDATRAAINYFRLGSMSAPRVAMYGYSGSAHAVAWAAGLAKSYAPELNIVGATYGGTVVDLLATYNTLNNGTNSSLAGGALWGLARGYPALARYLDSKSTKIGRQARDYFYTNGICIRFNGAAYNNFDFNTTFTTAAEVFAAGSPLGKILANESLLTTKASLSVPTFPRFVYHGNNDTTVPFGPAVAYVRQQCKDSGNLSPLAFNIVNQTALYPGNHGGALLAGYYPALDFINNALNLSLPTITCGERLPGTGSG